MRLTNIVVALALAAPLAAQQKVDIGRPSTPDVSVRLSGALGSVKITAWERDSVAIVGGLGAGSRLDGGTLFPTGVTSGMKFYVEAADESALRGNRLELRVPRNARVWVKTGSADIEATGVTGGLDLNIVGGSVKVNARPRELIIESMDGSVTVAGGADFARVKTATGDIMMSGRGEDVLLTTISGAITVTELAVQRGRFESVTGPITFAGEVAREGDARFDTHSGAIELRLKPQANVDIEASTLTGAIENAFSARQPKVGREGRGMELMLSSGNGSARVLVKTFKGNVRIGKQ